MKKDSLQADLVGELTKWVRQRRQRFNCDRSLVYVHVNKCSQLEGDMDLKIYPQNVFRSN